MLNVFEIEAELLEAVIMGSRPQNERQGVGFIRPFKCLSLSSLSLSLTHSVSPQTSAHVSIFFHDVDCFRRRKSLQIRPLFFILNLFPLGLSH